MLKTSVFSAGHYEGVDQRLLDEFIDEEISIGDYVLTGGEIPAMVFADALSRMVPGVLSTTNVLPRKAILTDFLSIRSTQNRRSER